LNLLVAVVNKSFSPPIPSDVLLSKCQYYYETENKIQAPGRVRFIPDFLSRFEWKTREQIGQLGPVAIVAIACAVSCGPRGIIAMASVTEAAPFS
jgi:hypothetical protein